MRADGSTRDVEGPGANVTALEERVVDERLTQLLSLLGAIHPDACCAGAAGAEVPEARARLGAVLRRLLPGSRVCVVHDSRLVLAAAGLDAGIALIAGTGSVAFGRDPDGREVQRGGWGWVLGDEGSGVWITREAARLVLARMDHGYDLGALGARLLDAVGVADARAMSLALLERHEPREWAALASIVFDTADDDAGSREIIRRAGTELAKLVASTGMSGPVVLAGGLLLHRQRLEDVVRTSLPQFQCIRLNEPPVEGAVRLAEEMLTS